ncbi:GNAT family N-acetyltransferase [Peptostreptococcaceae bacterium OttesenSCG-928-C18]|nr:GNAT family N-acetyltransferase [Peptostreptococcaceae bacterium OttesenSCG-928-C18]
MNVIIINSLIELKKYEKKWLTLENKVNLKYYSKFEYLKYWIDEVISKGNELFIIAVDNGEEFCGIAPLYIEKRKAKFVEIKELKFIGSGDYFNFIVDESKKYNEIYKLIFNEIDKNSSRYDRVILNYIDFESKLARYILMSEELSKSFNFLVEIPRLDFIKCQKLNISKNMKNYRNKLLKDSNYKMEIINGDKIDDNLFKSIAKIHEEEQKYLSNEKNRINRYSILSEEVKGKVYNKLLVGNKNTIIFLLRDNTQEIIAYKICYFYENEYFEWNTGYNPKYSKYRPNNTLYIEIFNHLLNTEFKGVYDFGAGRYSWKYRWANQSNFVYEYDKFYNTNFKIKLYNKLKAIKELL